MATKWIDLSVGNFDNQFFLLQGKRKRNGKVKFRVESTIKRVYYAPAITLKDLEKLNNL